MKKDTATWNRDDRDLLVELRTEMGSMRSDLAAARVEIKEINTGITARLLNLESNTVVKLQHNQLEGKVVALDILVNDLLKGRAVWRGQIKIWVILGGGTWTIFLLLATKYFHV